jgi:hypothetical protein
MDIAFPLFRGARGNGENRNDSLILLTGTITESRVEGLESRVTSRESRVTSHCEGANHPKQSSGPRAWSRRSQKHDPSADMRRCRPPKRTASLLSTSSNDYWSTTICPLGHGLEADGQQPETSTAWNIPSFP